MRTLIEKLQSSRLLTGELDYHLLRASMVVIFAWFGYDKWFTVEIQGLIPLITHGPLIFWTIPVLGVRGTSILLGTSEWTFGTLLLLGFWNRTLGVLGALGSTATFIATFTILPFVPGAWEAAAGGFPAMSNTGGFLLKDLVLIAVSLHLLKCDLSYVISRPATASFGRPTRLGDTAAP